MPEGPLPPAAAVVVLSREFVQKPCPMKELALFLKRQAAEEERQKTQQDDTPQFVIIPVLWGMTFEECRSQEEELLERAKWPDADQCTLTEWAGMLRQLLKTTCARKDQVRLLQQHYSITCYDPHDDALCQHPSAGSQSHCRTVWT
jgi:hypothetical protein